MQPNWGSLLFAVCVLVVLSRTVDAAITLRCPSGGCQGPLLLAFDGAECEGEAFATPLFNNTRYPDLGENVCLPYTSSNVSYTCGSGEFRQKDWVGSNCDGEPLYESMRLTHTCVNHLSSGPNMYYSMMVCGPDDLSAPVTPPTNSLPNPADPVFQPNLPCPSGVCRPGFASYIIFNESSTCMGPSETYEVSSGVLGVCYRESYTSSKTMCDENVLRRYDYAGSCEGLVVGYVDSVRRPSTCTRLDLSHSRTEIYCPVVSPTFQAPMAPTPSGHAPSMPIPLLLTFIFLAITLSISFKDLLF